mmetsp:Transcript_11735/g.21789  ORF Transcript_11735/g.21789 Transcript_11735/m.21789 type:complete len:232 (+) Transcript_11735:89-784(+)
MHTEQPQREVLLAYGKGRLRPRVRAARPLHSAPRAPRAHCDRVQLRPAHSPQVRLDGEAHACSSVDARPRASARRSRFLLQRNLVTVLHWQSRRLLQVRHDQLSRPILLLSPTATLAADLLGVAQPSGSRGARSPGRAVAASRALASFLRVLGRVVGPACRVECADRAAGLHALRVLAASLPPAVARAAPAGPERPRCCRDLTMAVGGYAALVISVGTSWLAGWLACWPSE